MPTRDFTLPRDTMRTIDVTPQGHWKATMQANPGSRLTDPNYDPLVDERTRHTQQQVQVVLAQHHGTPITLDASGQLKEAPAAQEDPRLTAALKGRRPASREELDDWLIKSDNTLAPDQRGALGMLYEHAYGVLPSVPRDDAATKEHTLATLGLSKWTRLTEAELYDRMRQHGVPAGQHLALTVKAYANGHIVRHEPAVESRQGETVVHAFSPAVPSARQEAPRTNRFGIDVNAAAAVSRDWQRAEATIRAGLRLQRRPVPRYEYNNPRRGGD